MKIVLVGGGTGGPITPLLAAMEAIRSKSKTAKFYYIGDGGQVERQLLSQYKLPYFKISAGKWRRYFSLMNIVDIPRTIFGFFQSLFILKKLRADAVLSAGSYVSVPVAYAAFLLGAKVFAHQQDIVPTLSNKLIFPVLTRLTLSLRTQRSDFPEYSGLLRRTKKTKIRYTGQPIRSFILKGDKQRAVEAFGLEKNLPTLLILGGGTGASALNRLIFDSLPQLTQSFQIIHACGKGKLGKHQNQRYHQVEFLGSILPDAIRAADLVISRAGFSYTSEILSCRKISILIPLPESHQVENARYFWEQGAVLVAFQHKLTPEILVENLRKLLFEASLQKELTSAMKDIMPLNGAERVAEVVLEVLEKTRKK